VEASCKTAYSPRAEQINLPVNFSHISYYFFKTGTSSRKQAVDTSISHFKVHFNINDDSSTQPLPRDNSAKKLHEEPACGLRSKIKSRGEKKISGAKNFGRV